MPVKREQWIPAHGEEHLCAKLTMADVLRIKEKAATGVSQASICLEFGMSSSQISRILTGKRWARAMAQLENRDA